jgi:Nif-specific regulatory protein
VRELENCIQHAILVSEDGVIRGHNLPPTLQTPTVSEITEGGSLTTRVNALEKDMIIDALKNTNGNISAAARELGITARMVRYKLKKLEIDYEELFKKRR